MKKARNGFIRTLRYFCLLGVIVLGLITIVGTGGGGGGKSTGTAPEIYSAKLYNNNWVETYNFNIGGYVKFMVCATDPNKNMETLYINQYYPSNATTPYYSNLLPLPSTAETWECFYSSAPTLIQGPSGNWRVEFQIEDSKGNESNIWKVYALVN